MNRSERRRIAKEIAQLEKQSNKNNIPEEQIMAQMTDMVKNCTFEDLLNIDAIIMQKYLTN